MVASVDGQVTAGGKATSIGSDTDRHTMRNLRANSDAVMVGANTLRAEKISLGLDDNASQGPQPLAVILTASGDAPLRANLVSYENQTVLVVVNDTIAEERAEALGTGVTLLRIEAASDGRPHLLKTLQSLKRDHAVERLLVEGGPTLNRAMISGGLVDELFLTLAPKLLGGGALGTQTILSGDLPAPKALRLISSHLASDELFLRYALSRTASTHAPS